MCLCSNAISCSCVVIIPTVNSSIWKTGKGLIPQRVFLKQHLTLQFIYRKFFFDGHASESTKHHIMRGKALILNSRSNWFIRPYSPRRLKCNSTQWVSTAKQEDGSVISGPSVDTPNTHPVQLPWGRSRHARWVSAASKELKTYPSPPPPIPERLPLIQTPSFLQLEMWSVASLAASTFYLQLPCYVAGGRV